MHVPEGNTKKEHIVSHLTALKEGNRESSTADKGRISLCGIGGQIKEKRGRAMSFRREEKSNSKKGLYFSHELLG